MDNNLRDSNNINFPFPGGSSGRLLDLRSVFNERAGPREAPWFWNRNSGLMSHMNTPDYAQASNLYPHLAQQQDTNYRYRPSGAAVIPVVHVVSNNTRTDSPGGSVGSPAGWVPQHNFTTWPSSASAGTGSEIPSPASTLRSGMSGSGSGYSSGMTPSASTGEVARSPTTSTASSKTDTEAEVDALTSLLMQSMEPKGGVAGAVGGQASSTGAGPSMSSVQGLRKTGQAVSIPIKTVSTLPGNKPSNKSSTLTGSPNSMSSGSSNNSLHSAVECFRCHRRLNPTEAGQGHIKVGALKTHFHASCFSCYRCSTPLHQDAFFHAHKRLLCPRCVTDALESCVICDRPITERVIRALGKPYHPTCFACSVCGNRLDGKPFTVDVHNRIHCLDDFHKRYAPRCASCGLPITPQNGRQETKRVVANDNNFHLECFGMRTVE